jgi:hypothetical protein
MGRVPLEVAWRATVVIGVSIIHVFEREREKIHSMGRGMSKEYLVTEMGRPARLPICNLLT